TGFGEHFEQQRVRHTAIDDVAGPDAGARGIEDRSDFRQHAAGDHALGDEVVDFLWRQAGEQLAVLVEHAWRVGEHDQLLGAQDFGQLSRHQVGVDVVGGAVGAGGDRRHHRDESGLLQRRDHHRIDRVDLANLADVDLRLVLVRGQHHLACADERAVLAGEAHGLAARLIDQLDDFLVHLAAEHHFDHVHGRRVGDAHALYERALHAQARERGLDLRPAAVHHHRVHADEQQHHVAREIRLEDIVGHGVAAEFDDDGLAVEALDVGQRFGEDARLLGGLRTVVVGGVHGAPRYYRKTYWMVIDLRAAAAFFGSVNSSTPSRNFASAFASSSSCGSEKLRETLPKLRSTCSTRSPSATSFSRLTSADSVTCAPSIATWMSSFFTPGRSALTR